MNNNLKFIVKNLYRWCTKTRLRKILSSTLVVLILLTTIRFLFLKPKEVQAADVLLSFDEGYGTSSAVNDTNGTVSAGSITNAVWKQEEFCKTGKCLYFDGNQDYVSFADDSDLDFAASDNFTIEGWFRTPDTSAQRTLIAKYNSTAAGYKVYMDANGYLFFGADYDTVWTPTDSASTSTTAFDDNKWHFFSAVKTGTTSMTIYVDGNQYETDSSITNSTLVNADSFYVGIDGDGTSNDYTGFIDEVKVLRTARTAAEIKADYLGETPSRGTTASFGGDDQSYLSNGLAGYWKMDESDWTNDCTATSVTDSSGNGNNGKSCPSTTGPDPLTGKFGNAGNFDGSDDYIDAGTSTVLAQPGSQVTAAMWINPDTLDTAYRYFIVNSGGSDNPYTFYVGDPAASQGDNLRVAAGGLTCQNTANNLSTGQWQHIAFTYNAGTIQIYLNGSIIQTCNGGAASMTNGGGSFYIGGTTSSTRIFDGKIDDTRIYNRAFTPAEIAKLYNWTPGPTGYWKLDENSGQTVNDSSTNSISGTLGANSSVGTDDPTWRSGKYGSSVFLDGSNDEISISDHNLLDISDQVTLTAWVKIKAVAGGDSGIARKDGGYGLRLRNDGKIGGKGFGCTGVSTNATPSLETWYHVAWTFDESINKIYLNGVLDNSSSESCNIPTSGSPFQIGRDGSMFNGSIDDVRVYNYIRTPSQIIEDMNGGHPTPGSPIGSAVAHWSFDEGALNTCSGGANDFCDSSVNANDLAFTGSGGFTNNGKFGKAYDGGDNERATRADDSDFDFTASESFSISVWTNGAPASEEYILNKRSGNVGYGLYGGDDGSVSFGTGDAGSASFPEDFVGSDINTLGNGIWTHIVAVKEGTSSLTLYINGKPITIQDTSLAANGDLSNSGKLIIGDANETDGTDEWLGDIDEVQIYRSALSAESVKALYNQGFGQTLGSLSTDSSGNPSSSGQREYCPPGNTEGNCGGSNDPAPIGHWKLDENSGQTVIDSAGGTTGGTLGTNSSVGTDDPIWRGGKFGSALSFDGSNDYATTANFFNFTSTDSFTVQAWMKTTYTGAYGQLVDKGFGFNNTYSLYFDPTSAGPTFAIHDTSRIEAKEFSGSTYADGKWHLVTGVRDVTSDKIYLYVDGVQRASTNDTTTGNFNGAYHIHLGARGNTIAEFFNGQIDDARIYNYSRSPAQIAWDYNRGAPLAWWQMDEASWNGTTDEVKDASGNGFHGVADGNATTTTGIINKAGTFDGTGDDISLDDFLRFNESNADFSIFTWVKRAANGEAYIVSKEDADNDGWRLEFTSSNTVRCSVDAIDIDSSSTITDTNWHHVGCTIDRDGNGQIYIDGIANGTPTAISSEAMDTSFSIVVASRSYSLTLNHNGQIDDLRIYNYVLTPQQIKMVMNDAASTRFAPVTGTP